METDVRSANRLNDAIAEEILVQLVRRRWRQSTLAERLGENEMWVSRRLRKQGAQTMTVNDLQRIADALGVPVIELFPRDTVRPNNRSAALTVRPMSARRRDVSRPKGRPPAESTRPVSAVPANKRRPQPVGSPNRSMAA